MTTYYTMKHQVQQSSRASKCLVLVLLAITGAILSVSGSPIPSGRGKSNKGEDSKSIDPEVYATNLRTVLGLDKYALSFLARDYDFKIQRSHKTEILSASIDNLFNSIIDEVEATKVHIQTIKQVVSPEAMFKMPDDSLLTQYPSDGNLSVSDRIKAIKESMNNHRNAVLDVIERIANLRLPPEDSWDRLTRIRANMGEKFDALEGNLKCIAMDEGINLEDIWDTGSSDASSNPLLKINKGYSSEGEMYYKFGL